MTNYCINYFASKSKVISRCYYLLFNRFSTFCMCVLLILAPVRLDTGFKLLRSCFLYANFEFSVILSFRKILCTKSLMVGGTLYFQSDSARPLEPFFLLLPKRRCCIQLGVKMIRCVFLLLLNFSLFVFF